MSTHSRINAFIPISTLPHVSLIPQAVVYTVSRRHPICFWHKKHLRSVRCELVVDPTTHLLKTEYTDQRTCNTFTDKTEAERFLGREIPQLEHDGKLYVEKVRDVFTYYICNKCNRMQSKLMEMVFLGPHDTVSGPITTTTKRACPNCGKANIDIDISTEPSPVVNTGQDCDLAQ